MFRCSFNHIFYIYFFYVMLWFFYSFLLVSIRLMRLNTYFNAHVNIQHEEISSRLNEKKWRKSVVMKNNGKSEEKENIKEAASSVVKEESFSWKKAQYWVVWGWSNDKWFFSASFLLPPSFKPYSTIYK